MAGSYAKKAATPSKKPSGTKQSSIKRNSSILSFFQKTDTPPGATSRQARITQFATASSRSPSSGRGTPTNGRANGTKNDTSGALFLEDKKGLAKIERTQETNENSRSPTPDIWGGHEEFLKPDDPRYNENDSAIKRRKVDLPTPSVDETQVPEAELKTTKAPPPVKTQNRSGPFIDESDSEDDMEAYREIDDNTLPTSDLTDSKSRPMEKPVEINAATEDDSELTPSTSVRAATNNADNDEYANFDDIEEDELIGEEFRNRPWESEEQEREIDPAVDPDNDINDCSGVEDIDGGVNKCPICQTTLKGSNETVSAHCSDSGLLECSSPI